MTEIKKLRTFNTAIPPAALFGPVKQLESLHNPRKCIVTPNYEGTSPRIIDISQKKMWLESKRTYRISAKEVLSAKFPRISLYNNKQIKGLTFEFPNELTHIMKAIENSSTVVDLEYGWDDEGAQPISFETWRKAISFLYNYAKTIYETDNVIIRIPDIAPVPDGSIDLTWQTAEARLLLNIKKAPSTIASYYGDYYTDESTFKGNVPLENINWFFLQWLKVFKI